MSAPNSDQARVRVILVSGPSGSGKSRLARQLKATHGWPIVELDDFYREGGDPDLPMSPLGIPDWDDARSWNAAAAADALQTLCADGVATVPRYDISTSARCGSQTPNRDGALIVIAEGIFAAHLIPILRSQGRLADAWCIRDHPWLTFSKRFIRDVRQRRKPIGTLWRRGHQLRRSEPGIVNAQISMGTTAMSSRTARLVAGDVATAPKP